MRTGDIVLVRFPFTDLPDTKVRPAVVVFETPDVHRDVIVCMISSVVPEQLNGFEILLRPDAQNGLRTTSIIKVYRIAIVDASKVLTIIGVLSQQDLATFTSTFQALVT
jgi:mRNA interferase MazF